MRMEIFSLKPTQSEGTCISNNFILQLVSLIFGELATNAGLSVVQCIALSVNSTLA